jgi:hypothetical protein
MFLRFNKTYIYRNFLNSWQGMQMGRSDFRYAIELQ